MSIIKKNFSWQKVLTVLGLATVTTTALAFGAYSLFNKTVEQAKAAEGSVVEMRPGDTGRFFSKYTTGPDTDLEDTVFKLNIGSELTVIPERIFQLDHNATKGKTLAQVRQEFNTIPKYRIDPKLMRANTRVVAQNAAFTNVSISSPWGYTLEYYPGSANNLNQPSGTATGGTLAKNIEGYVVVEGVLKSDIYSRVNEAMIDSANPSGRNYQPGDILDPITNVQGLSSFVQASNLRNSNSASTKIQLLASSSSSSSSSTSSSSSITSSSSSVTSSSSSSAAPTLGTISGGSLTGPVGGQAGGSIQLAGSTYTGPATYTNGTNCTIEGSILNGTFTPNAGETVDAGCPVGQNTGGTITAGNLSTPNAPSNFTQASSSSSSSAPFSQYGCNHNTRYDGDASNDECRLYFIGLDNKPLNWNSETQFNLDYPYTQKFRDGTVTMVFDQIKRNDGSLIADGSTCTFELTRYAKLDQGKLTLNGTTSGGKCQVEFTKELQRSLKYYRVKVIAADKNDGQKMVNIDSLVVIIGGFGDRPAPALN